MGFWRLDCGRAAFGGLDWESQISVVWWRFLGIFGYVFWVHGYAAVWYGGLRRHVHGFLAWFAAGRSVCSWVCVNFDLIFFFFVGHLLDSEFAIGLI